ncbi:endonuclease III domain-containing protein [Rhizobium puerariae]|uniref:Endonuclease III domain-containing protein n=1 Tax=Rhizobium puerariae TaxID=1585791 RepID=A0ABV6AJM0_9HYPH
MREGLRSAFAGYRPHNIREPVGQLVKSMISSRTKDEVSLRAYQNLTKRYRRWSDLAKASVAEIERSISSVTYANDKASYVRDALGLIARDHPDFDLSFLRELSVPEALAWLQALPGVGRKVAASTLNFSTLAMPAFVVDTHVLRVLIRFGVVGARADIEAANEAVMAAVPHWTAFELSEFHVLTKRLGQLSCRFDDPSCSECPLKTHCRFAGSAAMARTAACPPDFRTAR